MLTKTQMLVMGLLVSRIRGKFTIKGIAEALGKPYPLIHRSAKALMTRGLVNKDDHGLLSLEYMRNPPEIAYVEYLRRDAFLRKNSVIGLFAKDVLEKVRLDFYIFLVFGSAVKGGKARDIDMLFVVENEKNVESTERVLHNISSNFTEKLDIGVVTAESVYEMLSRRKQPNVMNETLDNHIIIYGAENYYRIVGNAG